MEMLLAQQQMPDARASDFAIQLDRAIHAGVPKAWAMLAALCLTVPLPFLLLSR